MDVQNILWSLRQKFLQHVLAGLQFPHTIGHAARVAAFFNDARICFKVRWIFANSER
jgi:hypothetical protein